MLVLEAFPPVLKTDWPTVRLWDSVTPQSIKKKLWWFRSVERVMLWPLAHKDSGGKNSGLETVGIRAQQPTTSDVEPRVQSSPQRTPPPPHHHNQHIFSFPIISVFAWSQSVSFNQSSQTSPTWLNIQPGTSRLRGRRVRRMGRTERWTPRTMRDKWQSCEPQEFCCRCSALLNISSWKKIIFTKYLFYLEKSESNDRILIKLTVKIKVLTQHIMANNSQSSAWHLISIVSLLITFLLHLCVKSAVSDEWVIA